jgi:hypothetical protein
MQTVPQPRNLMSLIGTGIENKFDYGGSDASEAQTLRDVVKSMEKFEIGHGEQPGGIRSYGSDDYIHNDINFDEPTQHKDLNRNTNNRNSNEDNNEDTNEDTNEDNNEDTNEDTNEDNNEDGILVEHFNGSRIIEKEEKLLICKCICVAVLFVIINYSIWDKYILYICNMISISGKKNLILLKTILFCVLFYITEKFLLK